MPSSISSSNERLPAGPWGRVWIFTALIVVGLLAAFEIACRKTGNEPAVINNERLWCDTRVKLKENDTTAVVVLGESRIMNGLSIPALYESLGGSYPIQLALPGSSAIPMLKNIALETSFSGTLVMNINEEFVFDQARSTEGPQRLMLETYKKQRLLDFIEYRLRIELQNSFAFKRDYMGIEKILKNGWPKPEPGEMRDDRFMPFDFSKVKKLDMFKNMQRDLYSRLGVAPTPAQFDEQLIEFEDCVQAIRKRGGHVLFVRMPSKGQIRKYEQERFPREKYWDVFITRVSAVCIHADDYPELSKYDCPDESHLDGKDTGPFTKSLIAIAKPKLDAPPELKPAPRKDGR